MGMSERALDYGGEIKFSNKAALGAFGLLDGCAPHIVGVCRIDYDTSSNRKG